MWIRDVNFPEQLAEAHREGELVIFVGAGASLGSPSNLPDFKKLTEGIARESGVTFDDAELNQPDVALGALEVHHSVDVHRRVKTRIGVPSSTPNRLHRAIVALASAGSPIRIVTTNYDLHLSTVLAEEGLRCPEHMSPALPMGDDFEGLVYLHGCLRQDPRHLVMTDEDFGRAYLRDAWAARFLERMFATYTVLFVGYSHGDIVMRYLGRSLRPGNVRYLLTNSPDEVGWRSLRIKPIGFELRDGSYEALDEAIERWAQQACMGLLDHRQKIAQLVTGPPSRIPEDESYLGSVVADENKVGFFVEHARGPDWLGWLSAQSEFRIVFDPSATATKCSTALADWFAQHFILNEELTDTALALTKQLGSRLGPELWSAIGHRLHAHPGPRPAWLAPWVVLLIESAPRTGQPWLEFALVGSRLPADRSTALLLFDKLTEPRLELRPTFVVNSAAAFDVQTRGEAYWLGEAWQAVFRPDLVDVARNVLVIVERQLQRAHHLFRAVGAADAGWDPVSFRRSAIEPHPQDRFSGPLSVVIDAARDCLQVLFDEGDSNAAAYVDLWSGTDIPILQRLAIHGWNYRTDVDATTKLAWLQTRKWLYDVPLQHEAFSLIESTLPYADTEVADTLVEDAVAGPAGDNETRDYRIFNTLIWMTTHAPDLRSARDALAHMTEQHPDYGPRDHPDLNVWFESGFVAPGLPMTTEALHNLVQTSAADAIDELQQYEEVTDPFRGPSREGARDLLVQTVNAWPKDGFAIIDASTPMSSNILAGVIHGWARATMDDETAGLIVDRLLTLDLAPVAADVATLLGPGGQNEADRTQWQRVPGARRLAALIWPLVDRPLDRDSAQDWLQIAINHPAGHITLFWISALVADWRDAAEDWSGLPADLRADLEALLQAGETSSEIAEIVFASQLHVFFAADRSWCKSHVLPLLDWTEPRRARRTWDGFLTWGRWSNQLLASGLLHYYVETVRRYADFADDVQRQLWNHLAGIAISSDLDGMVDGWLKTFTIEADEKARANWIQHVRWLVSELPAEAVEYQWQRWMREYWIKRLDSTPRPLADAEASAMAGWVPYLTGSLSEGVTLATQRRAGITEHSNTLSSLTAERVAQDPAAVAELLLHLLRGTDQPFYDGYALRQVVQRLRASGSGVDITGIIEQAVRLQCRDAPNW